MNFLPYWTSTATKDTSANTVLIHIGKCGGTTVRAELNKNEIRVEEKHLCQVPFNPKQKYIIAIRNPIARFVSAFNWRYKLVVKDRTQGNRFAGEKMRLEQYQTVSNLAENIYSTEGTLSLDFRKPENYIHHIKEDIDFYIGEFLDECDSKNILAVVTTEHLEADLRHHFDIQLESHLRKNTQSTYLSPAAMDNLVKYLQKDFECIDKLHSLKLLSERQYAALSSKHPA